MKIDDLEKHLGQTPAIASELRGNCSDLKNLVDETLKVIGLPRQAADKLNDLSKKLDHVSTALQIASIVKSIKGPADQLKRQVDSLKKAVDDARQKAATIADKLEGTRQTLEDLSKALQDLITILDGLVTSSTKALGTITAVHQCIDKIQDATVREHGLDLLNDFADICDPLVVGLNDAMTKANDTCDTIKKDFSQLVDQLNVIPKILNGIDDVSNLLDPIIGPLDDLCAALDKKIGLKRFHFTIRQILNGIKLPWPFSYLEDKFWDMAMDILNPILKRLHLDITLPDIPGLDVFAGIDLSFFDQLGSLMKTFTDLESLIPNVLNVLAKFDVTCPPKTDAKRISIRVASELAGRI